MKGNTWGVGELAPLNFSSWFYKNCRSVRKRGGKICDSCPFRVHIEKQEKDRIPAFAIKRKP